MPNIFKTQIILNHPVFAYLIVLWLFSVWLWRRGVWLSRYHDMEFSQDTWTLNINVCWYQVKVCFQKRFCFPESLRFRIFIPVAFISLGTNYAFTYVDVNLWGFVWYWLTWKRSCKVDYPWRTDYLSVSYTWISDKYRRQPIRSSPITSNQSGDDRFLQNLFQDTSAQLVVISV